MYAVERFKTILTTLTSRREGDALNCGLATRRDAGDVGLQLFWATELVQVAQSTHPPIADFPCSPILAEAHGRYPLQWASPIGRW